MTQRCLTFTLNFVIPHEGSEYENDPQDPGGATKFGIDQRSHPNVDIKALSKEEACDIYFDEWEESHCQAMPPKLGESHFDAVVNTGSGRAKRFLALSGGDAKQYNNERAAFYHRLAVARPSSHKFLKGWLRRVSDLNQFLHIT